MFAYLFMCCFWEKAHVKKTFNLRRKYKHRNNYFNWNINVLKVVGSLYLSTAICHYTIHGRPVGLIGQRFKDVFDKPIIFTYIAWNLMLKFNKLIKSVSHRARFFEKSCWTHPPLPISLTRSTTLWKWCLNQLYIHHACSARL